MQHPTPHDPNSQRLRGTHQIYPRGMQPPPPAMTPPWGHSDPPSGGAKRGDRIGLLIVAVIALLVLLMVSLSVVGAMLPEGDPNRGVVALAVVLGGVIGLIGIVRLLGQSR